MNQIILKELSGSLKFKLFYFRRGKLVVFLPPEAKTNMIYGT